MSIDNTPEKIKAPSYQSMLRLVTGPPARLCMLYGDETVFRFSLMMAGYILQRGDTMAVIDGSNRFDVHAIVRFAQRARMNPDEVLQRIWISRGFTCYQMEEAISDRLPPFLARIGSRTAMVFGLLDTFYDQQAPLRDVRRILARIAASLRALQQQDVSVLVTCIDRTVEPPERNQLLTGLKQSVDYVYRLQFDANGRAQLLPESARPGLPRRKRPE